MTSTVPSDEDRVADPEAKPDAEPGASDSERSSSSEPASGTTGAAGGDEEATVEPVPPDPEARSFGEDERAWAVVEVSEDGQQAIATAIALNGWETTARGLAEELAHAFGLRATFDGRVLRRFMIEAASEAVRGKYPIAHGSPSEPGADGRVEILIGAKKAESAASSLTADFAAALARETLDEVLQAGVAGVLVAPEQPIARLVPPTEGTAGQDVYGKELTAAGNPASATPGAGVRLEEDQLVAEVFGYVRRVDATFEVVPPVWVSADAMEAHLVHYPERVRLQRCDPEWIAGALQAAGVTQGADVEAIAALCAQWPAATDVRAVKVASGTPPQDGVDTHVEFEFNPDKRAGAVQTDGSIDFRERNGVIGVSEGQLIGRVAPSTEGVAGCDLQGQELSARDGEERQIGAGENVKAQSEDGKRAFYSEIDGAVNVSADAVEVLPIYTISGDVDFESGNIDLPMNVEIGGVVRTGFEVKAGGSVVVGGALEPGARVVAGGDVIVSGGIFGDTTHVVAKGNVETKLIQNATVALQGDLTVGSYIYHGIVRAGGRVAVEDGGSARAGSIVGGEIIAGRSVRARLIGSAETDRTLVGIGVSAEQEKSRSEAEHTVTHSNHEISRLINTLDLRGATKAEMKARLARCRDDTARTRVEEEIAELEAAMAAKVKAQETLTQLQEELDKILSQGTVSAETIFPDVYLDFGGEVSRVEGQTADAEFYRSSEGVRWRPT